MKVGDKIREARLEAGLSQRQVAQMLGVTQQYIQAIERNKSDFKFSTFMSLTKILEKKPSWFCEEGEKQDLSSAAKTLDFVIRKTDALSEAQAHHLREFFKEFKMRAAKAPFHDEREASASAPPPADAPQEPNASSGESAMRENASVDGGENRPDHDAD